MSLYKVGDELLVYLREDNTEHIVKVSEVDSSDTRRTYKVTCLYAYLFKFDNEWLNNEYVNILRKVTASDIEAFRKNYDIRFKIGDKVLYEGNTDIIEMFDISDFQYLLENSHDWVEGEDLELATESTKNLIYEEGDKLLVLLKKNNSKHIVKVSTVDADDKKRTYCLEGLYAHHSTFDYNWIWNDDIEIIKKVTDSDIDSFCKEHNISFRIGDKVVYERDDTISEYDFESSKYFLEDSGYWIKENQLELASSKKIKYSVDDIIIVKIIEDDTQHIVQITQIRDTESNHPYKVKCLYADYGMFYNCLLDTRDVKILKKATDKDIEEYLNGNGLEKKIGDKVFYNNKQQTIECFDSSDSEYFLKENEDWVKVDDLDDSIELSYSVGQTILVNDGDRHILEIVDIDEESDEPYTVKCLYGDYSEYDDKCISESDIEQLLSEDEVDVCLDEELEIKYRIGQNLIYCGLKCEVLHYDTTNDSYFIRCENRRELYVSEDELLEHSFKEGDLVKVNGFSDTIAKIIYLCDDGDIEVSILIGNADNLDVYYKPSELEATTQKELEYLQKNFTYKIGDKVFYEGEEDTIITIDNTDKTYLIEDYDEWVSEDEISKTDGKVENPFKIDDLVKIKGLANAVYKIIDIDCEDEIEVDLVIGVVNFDSYHNPDNLEIATQQDIDYLQKDFAYKIGEKILYDEEEDVVEAIDMKSISSRYFLRDSEDWVSEKEISSIGKKHNFIFKTESKATQIINDETPVAEKPKRRLLLG